MPKAKRYVHAVYNFDCSIQIKNVIVQECFSVVFCMCIVQALLISHDMQFFGYVYRKRYVNPYDRSDTVQQAEERKQVNEENNLSLTSRSAVHL